MRRHTLKNTGLDVPALSFGSAALGGVFTATEDAESIRTVLAAIDSGVDLIDTSPYYGNGRSESVLGKVLPGIPRDRFLLSTKCGRTGVGSFDFSAERINASIEESLRRLGLDHVDILLLHDIEFADLQSIVADSLPALDQVKQAGKARFIGFSGLPLGIFEEVVPAAAGLVDVVLSYAHYTLFDTTLLSLLPLLEEHGVDLMNASPTSMGLLTAQGPPDWHPAPESVRLACRRAAELCQARGTDIAELAIRFACANRSVPTTLVSAESTTRLGKNIAAVESPPDEELLAAVLSSLAGVKDQTWPSGLPENGRRRVDG